MKKSGALIIGNAIIWAAVIMASALVLRDTPHFDRMLLILGGGPAASMLILAVKLRRG